MNLTDFIRRHIPLTPDMLEDLHRVTIREQVPAHQVLVRPGQYCRKLFFIEEGLVRESYFSMSGKETTYRFNIEGAFVTVADSFLDNQPSRYSLETLEDSGLCSITLADFEELLRKHPVFEKLQILIQHQLMLEMKDRITALQFQTAKERYESLLENQPSIFQRVSLGHIASYLGISQETLSRIRSKK